jgi:hypothetical protein
MGREEGGIYTKWNYRLKNINQDNVNRDLNPSQT